MQNSIIPVPLQICLHRGKRRAHRGSDPIPAPFGKLPFFTVSTRSPLSRSEGGSIRYTGETEYFKNYEIVPEEGIVRLF